ncbi:hypothetical protein N7488_001358 [Penicillium malachiteum]|nr:hypothetical protein N7488_001358 [Penicillium malachiteum]
MSIALICEGIINSQDPDGSRTGCSIAGMFFLFAVSVAFSLSFGPCSWYIIPSFSVSLDYIYYIVSDRHRVYMAEVMPMQIRGKGSAFAVGVGSWAVSALWNEVSPIALGKIQWKYYFVFVAWRRPNKKVWKRLTYSLSNDCRTDPL